MTNLMETLQRLPDLMILTGSVAAAIVLLFVFGMLALGARR